jgi:hypothetical protein
MYSGSFRRRGSRLALVSEEKPMRVPLLAPRFAGEIA